MIFMSETKTPKTNSTRNGPAPDRDRDAACAGGSQDEATSGTASGWSKYVPALPVLAAQLDEVRRSIEASVVEVCTAFQGIASRARNSAAQVSRISNGGRAAGDGSHASVSALVSDTRSVLGSLVQKIEEANASTDVALGRLESMESKIAGMKRSLAALEDVTDGARVLALNGQLEAVKAGERGAAFAVVARGTAQLASDARKSCRSASELAGEISRCIDETSHELHQRAEEDLASVACIRDEVNRSLDRMTALHDKVEESLRQSERESRELARDIAAAVQALQFQDAVSQRIGHVIDLLEEMHAAMRAAGEADGADWAAMSKEYTMQAERRVLEAHLGTAPHAAEPENNVELF